MGEVAQLFSEHGEVEELDVDDDFLAHLTERATYAKHNVTLTEILQVHAGQPKYFTNVGTHRAPIIMVGPTFAGRLLCVPVEPTNRHGVWRLVTAFEANAHHRLRYQGGSDEHRE